MKKSFYIAIIAILSLAACNKTKDSNTETSSAVSTVEQDSIDKEHGHSHDPSGNNTPIIKEDSAANAAVPMNQPPVINQDSADKAHGHKH